MQLQIPNRITAQSAFDISFRESDLTSVISLLEEYYTKIREAAQENEFSITIPLSYLGENAKEIVYKYLTNDGYEVYVDSDSSPNSLKLNVSWLHKIYP
jgi:hypothetical protein